MALVLLIVGAFCARWLSEGWQIWHRHRLTPAVGIRLLRVKSMAQRCQQPLPECKEIKYVSIHIGAVFIFVFVMVPFDPYVVNVVFQAPS